MNAVFLRKEGCFEKKSTAVFCISDLFLVYSGFYIPVSHYHNSMDERRKRPQTRFGFKTQQYTSKSVQGCAHLYQTLVVWKNISFMSEIQTLEIQDQNNYLKKVGTQCHSWECTIPSFPRRQQITHIKNITFDTHRQSYAFFFVWQKSHIHKTSYKHVPTKLAEEW